VQWHPERLIHDEKHLRLMQWFIEQCSAHQTR
jgi:gamma-glutamyl-gamma-aminobutyrate hydrolase PuuD